MSMSVIGRRGSLVLHNIKSSQAQMRSTTQRRRSFTSISQPIHQAEPRAQQGYQRARSESESSTTDVLQLTLALLGLTLSSYCSHQLMTQRSAVSAAPVPVWKEQVQAEMCAGKGDPNVIPMEAVETELSTSL